MAATSQPKSATSKAANKKAATTAEPAIAPHTKSAEITLADYGSSGKPERSVFDKEQEKIKTEIDALQVKLVCIARFHF